MAGDYTRFRYDPLKDSTGILMQQGKVLVDQDWNESAHLQDRRWRTETTDIMGRAVVPIETPNGFEIQIAGSNLTIGRGRMYVDGLMAENHGANPIEFDPTLGEVRGTLPIPYDKQPYFPNPPALPVDNNPHLVYLDVWERELTYLEDADLIDKAIGIDTAARIQTVWQVKVLQDTPAGTACSTPASAIAETAPSAGRLTTSAAGVPSSADPCIVPLTGGYRGSGNRLYRVEIHNGGALGTAQFKWSRDNASVASAVTAINAARDTLSVVMTKRDSVLRFQPNDWIEIIDDFRYFHGLSGEMAQVLTVNDVNLTIQLKTPLPAATFDATKPERHTRVIRWDQSGIVRDPIGTVIIDVDTNNGLIPVPPAGTAIVLEDGIQIKFSIDAAMPVAQFRALEHWSFAARVIDASIEILNQAPPRGILHHYASLGFVTFPSTVTDCRIFWPPNTGDSCDCTVCVSADSHNSGKLTIQSAVNQVMAKHGGKVCLGPGVYNISEAIVIAGGSSIQISGHGLPSLQATPKLTGTPILLIERSVNIAVEDIQFAAGVRRDDSLPGIQIRETFFVRIKRCGFVFGVDGALIPNGRTLEPAIALQGVVVDTEVRDNFFNNVSIALGDFRDKSGRFIRALTMEANQIVCTQAGVRLAVPANTIFSEIRFAANFVQSPLGFAAIGFGVDLTVDANTFNLVPPPPTGFNQPLNAGILTTVSQARITNNQVFGNPDVVNANGILLGAPFFIMYGTRVIGNQLSNLTGNGIAIEPAALLLETIISQNQMLNLGGSGIVMLTNGHLTAGAIDLNIYENSLAFVAQRTGPNNLMSGILVRAAINVSICENAIENLGMNPGSSSSRVGILASRISGTRIAGNRLANIGPTGAVSFSVGIAATVLTNRVDVIDNQVRRSVAPPPAADFSSWLALAVQTANDASIRGNHLEGFGGTFSVFVSARNCCLFSDNQCFFTNPLAGASAVVGLSGNAVLASSNFIQCPRSPSGAPGLALQVVSTGPHSVLGNIATGTILVNAVALPLVPQLPQPGELLNVVTV